VSVCAVTTPGQAFQLLYVHVPFCRAKCAYCAFYSVAGHQAQLWAAYEQHLGAQLQIQAANCAELEAVFFGGGTPARLGRARFARLLQQLRTAMPIRTEAEITVEINPEFLTPTIIATLAAAGVNRISIGVQSFDPQLRARLGRHGDLQRLHRGMQLLQTAGIGNINFDLIYAIPGQTLTQWRTDLERALDMGITHLSAYSLTYEEGTALAGSAAIDTAADNDQRAVAMWQQCTRIAAAYGLQRYEVSNLAKPGFQCHYNQQVWHGQTYLGLGPAASSFDGINRWTQVADIHAWLRDAAAEIDFLPREQRAAEILAFGLRTVAGWKRQQFQQITGFDYMQLRAAALQQLAADALLELRADSVAPTARGLLFADTIVEQLL